MVIDLNSKKTVLTSLCLIVGLSACNKASDDTETSHSHNDELVTAVVKNDADIAYAVYSDSVILAKNLQQTLSEFIANPTAQGLQQTKAAWLAAREPYGQSEVYRFRMGPIDILREDGTLGSDGEGLEGRINAWPLGEALIDYIAPSIDGNAGPESPANALTGNLITNVDAYPEINLELLKTYFEHGEDERNVTTGYHAIEFLLWGQDLNKDGTAGLVRDTSPGQRPLTDFIAKEGMCTSGDTLAAAHICQRRGQYLLAATELLIQDLSVITESWHPERGSFYQSYVSAPNNALSAMFESMGRLSFGELAGERINIAVTTDSQEDEHSCFSDNTHRDIFLNAQGIQNTYLGKYTRIDGSVIEGTSIYDLLNESGHSDIANILLQQLQTTMQSAAVISNKGENNIPFDVLVQEGVTQPDINAMIKNLTIQTDGIERAINALNLRTDNLRQDTEQDLSL
ncbi:metalloproteinase [Alteromonas sp. 5E99-2]|uniref:imelysin family protein n=1 Tax=Alteromonas sp. 5E99-2 TaxID=2817683 RepID=UPI001A988E49|nr:imelysin family protein [Alteromonas sp. 5E99-2]MBO1255113.1 metalloproteinase [Alteromonas sp. 5E99-2]